MLLETLEDSKTYMKATLLQCLSEAHSQVSDRIPYTYKTVLKREKEGVDVYTAVRRDPATSYRLYTGLQIRKIVEYEINRAKGEGHEPTTIE